MPIRWKRPRWLAKPNPHSEIRAMLTEARGLHDQLEDTKEGLAAFMARAERVAELLETRGSATDEL